MKILFWSPYPSEGASNRYRIEQYLLYLKQEGIDYKLHSFWGSAAFKILYKKGCYIRKSYFFLLGTIRLLIDIMQISRYTTVFIHREIYPVGGAFFERILHLLKKTIIFDFDDAIFLSASSLSNNFIERFKKPQKMITIIKLSQAVIAGNSYLADFARQYNLRVSIIPTPIDTEKYFPNVNMCHAENIVIGWMGSITTLDFLKSMKRVFIKIHQNFEQVKFKIIGGDFAINGLPSIICKPWSMEEERGDLRTIDIGIMPMPDNEWTRGKCGFKAILYMSMGIPCVCSPVGMNKEIIKDGENGFLVNSEDEWFEKLSFLIKNTEVRRKIGLAGRKTVEEKYSVAANVARFLDILKSVRK